MDKTEEPEASSLNSLLRAKISRGRPSKALDIDYKQVACSADGQTVYLICSPSFGGNIAGPKFLVKSTDGGKSWRVISDEV